MNDVNSWLEVLVMVVAISGVTVASILGALLAIGRSVLRRFDAQIDGRIVRVVDEAFGPRFDAIDTRLDRVEGRLDRMDGHLERIDLRLDHLEGDMTIVKQRLIGVA